MSDLISRKALLEELEAQDYYGGFLVRLITNAPAIEQNDNCSSHPDAPHGFCRDASHTANRYVCECEGWTLASTPAQLLIEKD